MSAQSSNNAKYDPGTIGVEMTDHALERYDERLPDDAVPAATAWDRGEDIQHPGVVRTRHSRRPTRVRVYNHDFRYFAIFVVAENRLGPGVVTVYSLDTHEHGPTRAYLHSHGPHYLEDQEGER